MGTEIRTARLLLRPLEMADAPRMHLLCGDLAIARWLARVPHPYPEGDAERFIAHCRDSGDLVRAIERHAEPGLIGVIGVEEQELGYWLGVPCWGQGYATEAARAVIDRVFGGSEITALTSGVFEGNAASLRVQEKLGFRVTGRRMVRCAALDRELQHIDTALPRARWEARKGTLHETRRETQA